MYIYLYLWLIQVVVWQKPTQHCKACILQLKKKKLPTEKSPVFTVVFYQMFKEELILGFNITVIQVYAPTSNTEEAEVERFYEELQGLLELTPPKKISLSL